MTAKFDDDGPIVWAECTECAASWSLCRAWSFSKGWIWVWSPDCKCGKRKKPAPAPPRLVDINGPIVVEVDQ